MDMELTFEEQIEQLKREEEDLHTQANQAYKQMNASKRAGDMFMELAGENKNAQIKLAEDRLAHLKSLLAETGNAE